MENEVSDQGLNCLLRHGCLNALGKYGKIFKVSSAISCKNTLHSS